MGDDATNQGGSACENPGLVAKRRIIQGIKDFIRANEGTTPNRMNLPIEMALDLATCGENDLPGLSAKLVGGNPKEVLEEKGIFGLEVEVINKGELSFE
jgi:hypothetical protein